MAFPHPQRPGFVASWLTPTALIHDRMVERAGRVDRITRVAGTLCLGVLIWCTFALGPWALVPLVALITAIAAAPLAIRFGRSPQYWDFTASLGTYVAMGVAAAMTGGPLSPISYLMPIGLAITAMRGIPRATMIGALISASAFLVACVLRSPSTLVDHSLATATLMVLIFCIAAASTTLANAEIGYRTASVLDALTGLLNRQTLQDRFEELRQQASVADAPICLVLFDLDRFKAINDEHGHDVGDAILKEVANRIRQRLRAFELAYRIGGEEFLVLLPGIDNQQGTLIAEQLRETIGQLPAYGKLTVTASFGISSAKGKQIDFDALYRRADQALYHAKRQGRDRISASEPATITAR